MLVIGLDRHPHAVPLRSTSRASPYPPRCGGVCCFSAGRMFVKVDMVGLGGWARVWVEEERTWLVGKLDGLQVSKSYGPSWGIAGVVWWLWRNYGPMLRGGI